MESSKGRSIYFISLMFILRCFEAYENVKHILGNTTVALNTLVPEVFLNISSFCEAANMSRKAARKKTLVTLDLSLTFMQMPAVKWMKLMTQKGANGNLAITCLSATCFHSGGEEWYLFTYLARVNVHVWENIFIHNDGECSDLLNIKTLKHVSPLLFL